MNYTDLNDEEYGYRACLFCDDLDELGEVMSWLEQQGIAYDADYAMPSVMTGWVTDMRKATLLKMTWGGAT